MPSQMTHLAIAKRFLEKHPNVIKDVQRFLDGNVLPDLHSDKAVSHYGSRTERHDIIKYNREKVNPDKFLINRDMQDDLNKGVFLHLYVDYQYYNDFVAEYFKNIGSNRQQVAIDMYEVSRRDDAYLGEKYGVAYTDTTYGSELKCINDIWDQEHAERRRQKKYNFDYPYDFKAVDGFIEKMSDIIIPGND